MAFSNVRTFFNAFVTMLLKCVAALGFATPSRKPFSPAVPVPAVPVPAVSVSAVPVPAVSVSVPVSVAAPAPWPEATGDATPTLPSPRAYEPLRDRSRPPTMKQRIHAEAHGASPTARSLSGDLADSGPATSGFRGPWPYGRTDRPAAAACW